MDKSIYICSRKQRFCQHIFIYYSFKPHSLSKQHYLKINNFKEWII